MSDVRVVLAAGRDKSVLGRHPWIYSGSVKRIEGDPTPGALADLVAADGRFMARGYVNPSSQIVFRVMRWTDEAVDAALIRARIADALRLREVLLAGDTDAQRIVHGEGDLLPGLIVDRYGDYLVCQLLTSGMEALREIVLDALEAVLKPRGIWERSEGPARRQEGEAVARGLVRGEEPPDRITITEGAVRFAVDVRGGQKTGFYLDQRPARRRVHELALDRDVLDVFANSGAFAVNALHGGARHVTAIESSKEILARIGEHLALNDLDDERLQTVASDAFDALRSLEGKFDLIVVDPPPFAKRKGDVDRACRGYKEINMQAMHRLNAGGLLLTSSCSHHIDERLFRQVIFAAAKDAGRSLQVVERLHQPADHPVSLFHPEGEYLKSLLLRATD